MLFQALNDLDDFLGRKIDEGSNLFFGRCEVKQFIGEPKPLFLEGLVYENPVEFYQLMEFQNILPF